MGLYDRLCLYFSHRVNYSIADASQTFITLFTRARRVQTLCVRLSQKVPKLFLLIFIYTSFGQNTTDSDMTWMSAMVFIFFTSGCISVSSFQVCFFRFYSDTLSLLLSFLLPHSLWFQLRRCSATLESRLHLSCFHAPFFLHKSRSPISVWISIVLYMANRAFRLRSRRPTSFPLHSIHCFLPSFLFLCLQFLLSTRIIWVQAFCNFMYVSRRLSNLAS